MEKKSLIKMFKFTLKMLQFGQKEVIDGWCEVFEELLELVRESALVKEIQQIVVMLYDQFQPTFNKYSAIKILARAFKVAMGSLSWQLVKVSRDLNEKINQTCSDRDELIRKVFTEELLIKLCESLDPQSLEVVWLDKVSLMESLMLRL